MRKPSHRVAADGSITFGNVRPVSIVSETDKNAQRALVGALGQHDFITLVECRAGRSTTDHVRFSFIRQANHGLRYWRNLGLFRSLAFSSLVCSAWASSALRAASLCGAS